MQNLMVTLIKSERLFMKYFPILFVSLFLFFQNSHAGLYEKLLELKKICDAELITETECDSRKKAILNESEKNQDIWFCNYAGENISPKHFSAVNGNSFSESASASSIVKDILDEAGLAPNFIVRPSNVPNAVASSYDGMRFIEYNPNFINDMKSSSQTNWSIYSIMAHEIGHHLQGHTIQDGGSRPHIELEADEYSGFILAKLGADLSQSQMAMNTLGSDPTTGTHPATLERLNAIEKGWNKGMAIQNSTSVNGTTNSNINDINVESVPIQSEDTTKAETITAELLVTEFCVIDGESLMLTNTDAILSYANDYIQIGERVAPLSDVCFFDLVTNDGRYCVVETGEIYFNTELPVGKCEVCDEVLCGGL
jgi:hypothetical protein